MKQRGCPECGRLMGREGRCIFCGPTKSEAESQTLGEFKKRK